MVTLINYSSKTNNSVILTVEKIDVAPLYSLRAESRVGWGLKGGTQPSEFICKLEISKDRLINGES